MSWIDDYDKKNPYRTIEERCSVHQNSPAWEDANRPEIVTFITDDGQEWGFHFIKIESIQYIPSKGECRITWKPGMIVITGPKAKDCKNQFSLHEANTIKAAAPDISSVAFIPSRKKEQED
jgi:hypothetical protein